VRRGDDEIVLTIVFHRLTRFALALFIRARREEGQTMAEYGVLIVTIAVVVVVVAVLLGSSISALFKSTASHV
jgi:Flp pilus assembly pilin Flp